MHIHIPVCCVIFPDEYDATLHERPANTAWSKIKFNQRPPAGSWIDIDCTEVGADNEGLFIGPPKCLLCHIPCCEFLIERQKFPWTAVDMGGALSTVDGTWRLFTINSSTEDVTTRSQVKLHEDYWRAIAPSMNMMELRGVLPSSPSGASNPGSPLTDAA